MSTHKPALCLALLLALPCLPVTAADNLSARYPADKGIGEDPAVLFHEDFESGWGRWDYPQRDTRYLFIESDAESAHSGDAYLRSTISRGDLRQRRNISAAARRSLERGIDDVYWRLYARFTGAAPRPHHWIRLAATDGVFDVRGKANTVPDGDEAFWLALDMDLQNRPYFYAYWHAMRSGRCNDGSARPGCEGDQGITYHYGNVLRPESEHALDDGRWLCIEIHARANQPGRRDAEFDLYIDGQATASYRRDHPVGTWLRARFHPGGCDFAACTEPAPFEGVELRTDADVLFRQIYLDAYNQIDTFDRKSAALRKQGKDVGDVQTIAYDDIVVATERVGCMVAQ